MKQAIVLGGTEDHVHLIELLRARDYRVVLIDFQEDCPARALAHQHIHASALDRDTVLEVARSLRTDLVATWCIDQTVPAMAYASEQLGLPCYLSFTKALEFTNKAQMKLKMAASGIPTARHVVLTDTTKVPRSLSGLRYPLVVKPADANSSKGVVRVNIASELPQAIATAAPHTQSRTIIAEEFVAGDEFSADLFLKDGEPVLLVTTRTYKAPLHVGRFIICNSMSPSGLSDDHVAELLTIVRRISHAFDYPNGPLFIQFILGRQGLNVVEFSARVGGGSRHHFIRLSKGFDYLDFLVGFAHGEQNDIRLHVDGRFYGCQFAYARPGIMQVVTGLDQCRIDDLLMEYYLYKTPGSSITGNDASSHRPFGFITRADSFDSLREKVAAVDARTKILNDANEDIMIHGLHFSPSPTGTKSADI